MKWSKKLLALCVAALLMLLLLPVQAEEPSVTWADCCLILPADAPEPELVWYAGTGEPRVFVAVAPQAQREAVRVAAEAAPEWVFGGDGDGALGQDTALSLLRRMRCVELPVLPEDMVFEGVCFWAEGDDLSGMNTEERALMMVLVISSIALDDSMVIDLPLRIGFYDVETGTVLMAGWLDE